MKKLILTLMLVLIPALAGAEPYYDALLGKMVSGPPNLYTFTSSLDLADILTDERGSGPDIFATANGISGTSRAAVAVAGAVAVPEAATKVDNQLYSDTNGTITDFVDASGDHGDFVIDESEFWFLMKDAGTTIKFNANINIEGNAAVDHTGSATQIEPLHFMFKAISGTGTWICDNLMTGMSTPTELGVQSINTAIKVITPTVGDADTFTFTTPNIYGGTYYVNAAGTAAHSSAIVAGENWSLVVNGAYIAVLTINASDTIILNGTAGTQGHGLTGSGTAGDTIVVSYQAANTWNVIAKGFAATP